jgi:hypothetical protein
MKTHSLIAVSSFITASVGVVVAEDVVNPCNICPNGSASKENYSPYAGKDPITCKEIIENAKLFDRGTYWCSRYEMNEFFCCPPADWPVDPCAVCPDGITVNDEMADMIGCFDETIATFMFFESESDVCKIQGESFEALCCPTPAENPCVICPDGATVGDDFAPDADRGDPTTCKELIDLRSKIDAGSELCYGGYVEAKCCPAPIAPENPCIICPDGATAGDDFSPFSISSTCGDLIARAKLFETGSKDCTKGYEGYEISCCPKLADTAIATAILAVG